MALPGNLVISEVGLERLAQRYNIGELHHILRPTAVYLNENERADLDRRLNRELGGLPIFEGQGRLDRDFADSLRSLCRPEVAYAAMTHVQGRFRHLLACSLGREGIVAVRENERISLRQVDPGDLPAALVSVLPDHPAAKFQPISVPIEENQSQQQGVLRGRASSREREMWDQLASRTQVGGGQISLELRDAMGRSKESAEPLCFVDLDIGGWFYRPERRGEQKYLFCAPASRQELARQMQAMRSQLAPA